MALNIVFVALYFFGVLYIGWRAGRRETPQDFIIASRNVGFFRTTASIFAVLGGEMLIAQTALAYSLGFGSFWFWIGLSAGMPLLALAAPKIKEMADKHGLLNLSEYFGIYWGQSNRIFSALIIFVSFFALLALQFIAIGTIISPLFQISYALTIIVSGLVVVLYLLLGGYKAVVNTDLLQAILMFFLLIGLTFFIGASRPTTAEVINVSPTLFVSFLIIGVFVVFSSADIWQRIYSAKSASVARSSLLTVTLLFLVFGFFLTLVGATAKTHFPNIDPNQAFYWGLLQLLPPWLLGFAIVMVLATIMSTIDTEVYLISSTIAKDFVAGFRELSESRLIRTISWTMVILSLSAMVFAIFVRDVLSVLFGLASLLLSLAPAVIGSFFWKLKPRAVFASLLGGVGTFMALIIFGYFTPENSVATLPGAVILLILGQIVFRRPYSFPSTSAV